MAQFITADLYVSDVGLDQISLTDEAAAATAAPAAAETKKKEVKEKVATATNGKQEGFLVRLGKGIGGIVGKFYQAGRDTIDSVIRNVLPFMAFISMMIGIISASGVGDWIANTITPFAGTLPGLFLISIVLFNSIPVSSLGTRRCYCTDCRRIGWGRNRERKHSGTIGASCPCLQLTRKLVVTLFR